MSIFSNTLHIFTDGGSRGNPGPSGCGVHITDANGNSIEKRYKYIGIATNNIAEYTAALLGIKRAIELNAQKIIFFADSQLVIRQLSGEYKVKNKNLQPIFTQILECIEAWGGDISFCHIPREQNTEADRLANKAMDTKK